MLTNFGYSISGGAKFNSDLTFTEAPAITLDLVHAIRGEIDGVTTTISFQPGDISHVTFKADASTATTGST